MIANKKKYFTKISQDPVCFHVHGWFYKYQNAHRKGAIATMQNNLSHGDWVKAGGFVYVWAQNHHLGTAPAGFKVFHIQAVEGMPIFITLFIFI